MKGLVEPVFLPDEFDEFWVDPLPEALPDVKIHGVARGQMHDEQAHRGDPEKERYGLNEPL